MEADARTGTEAGRVGWGVALGAAAFSGAMPQVLQYPSSICPVQPGRWQRMASLEAAQEPYKQEFPQTPC